MARADVSYLFGCITTIVVTLARITLLIGCGLVAIHVIGATFDQSSELLGIDSIKEPGQVMSVFVVQGFFLGNCLMGMIGSYTRDPGHLAMFALVPTAAEFMIVFGTVRRYVNLGHGGEFINFKSKLEEAGPKYLWDTTTDTPKNEATKLWDSVQESMKCCGLENMYDWNQWRPEGVDNNTLPVSCCLEKHLSSLPENVCHYDQAFRMGCLDKHEDISILNLINAMIPMILILCIPVNLAFIIYKRKKAPASSEIKDVPEIYPRL